MNGNEKPCLTTMLIGNTFWQILEEALKNIKMVKLVKETT